MFEVVLTRELEGLAILMRAGGGGGARNKFPPFKRGWAKFYPVLKF